MQGLFIAYGTGEISPEIPVNYLDINQAALDVGYVNADTLIDIIAVTLSKIYILINEGNRSFSVDSIPLDLSLSNKAGAIMAPSFVTAHFNNDLYLDMVIASNQVSLGDEITEYSNKITLPVDFSVVNACDFNNDWYDDIVGIANDSAVILLNDKAGSFYISQSIYVDTSIVDLAPSSAVIDFNDDGICDFAFVVPLASSPNQSMITYAITDGNGLIAQYDTIRVNGIAYNLTVADADRDAIIDLIIANGTTQQLEVYFGDGFGGFSEPSYVDIQNGSDQTFALASLDLNRDGKFDFVSGSLGGGSLILAVDPDASGEYLEDEMWVVGFDETTIKVYNPNGYVISEDLKTVAGSDFQELDIDSDNTLDDRTMDYNLEYGESLVVGDLEPEAGDGSTDEPLMTIVIGIDGSQQATVLLDYNASSGVKGSNALVDSILFYYTVEQISSIQPENGIPNDRSRPLFEWNRMVDTIPTIDT